MNCLICKDPEKKANADRLLLNKASVRDVGAQVGVSKSAVDRHKRTCLAKTLATTAPKPVEAKPLAAQEPIEGEIVDAKTIAPIRQLNTAEDYHAYMQWLQDHSTRLVEDTAGSDNYRIRQVAIKEARDNATAVAKTRGWVHDTPANDNRTLNVFANMSPDALLALRDALSAT